MKTTPGPWIWCSWTILEEDRPAQDRGEPYWTIVEGNDSLSRGPIGRKAMSPERIIEGTGYEVDGIDVPNEVDRFALSALPELLEVAKGLVEAWAGIHDGGSCRSLPDCYVCRAAKAIAKVEGGTHAAP